MRGHPDRATRIATTIARGLSEVQVHDGVSLCNRGTDHLKILIPGLSHQAQRATRSPPTIAA
jgi:hypothetical protein